MNITKEELQQHYRTLGDDELFTLYQSSEELTEFAASVLQKEVESGGLTVENIHERESKHTQEHLQESEERPSHKGVGGWLLLFCLSLTFFNPLLSMRNLVAGYQGLQPYFQQIPNLLIFAILHSLFSLGVIGWGIYAGAKLWRVRLNAVTIAKSYLLGLIGYAILSTFLPFVTGLPGEVAKTLSIGTVKVIPSTLVYMAIWYTYLNKSKRVKATFEKMM